MCMLLQGKTNSNTLFVELMSELCKAIKEHLTEDFGHDGTKFSAIDIVSGYHSYMIKIKESLLDKVHNHDR